MTSRISSMVLFIALATVTECAQAEPVTTIRNNGDSANRVDIVVLGDGYTADEIGKYASDVEQFIGNIFMDEPYSEYQRYFNVHRIDVVSAESGIDHPELGVYKNTALHGTYDCAGIQRLVCVDYTTVVNIVASSVGVTQRDVIIVIVNDPEYGGSGGAIAVTSLNFAGPDLVLHELGHTLALLADEYSDSPPPCDSSVEPAAPNVTKANMRETLKWNYWVDASTPIPTFCWTVGLPGLYEGAMYCEGGLFRPTCNSKMRSLFEPFEQINTEQHIKRFYNWVSPIDSVEPPPGVISVNVGETQSFSVSTLEPMSHSLAIAWMIDGQQLGFGLSFTFNNSSVQPGSHNVQLVVSDPTTAVRDDPGGVLLEREDWIVEVTFYKAYVQQPINPDGSSVFNVMRGVVPVKFTLTKNNVATCSLPSATISLTRTEGGAIGRVFISGDTNFRIDATDCQYVYNLTTRALGVGVYRVDIAINGSVVGSGRFALN